MIGIFSNELSASKSLLPVIIQFALPESASSRYLLSLGSRQRVTVCDTSTILYRVVKRWMKRSLSYSFLKYLSNFFFFNVLNSSWVVGIERIKTSFKNAFRTARSETDCLIIAALITTFASMTTVKHYSSFSKSFSLSSVRPCFLAYSLMSSITSNNVRLSSKSRASVSMANCFSTSVSRSNFEANSSLTFSVMFFIQDLKT